MSNQPESSGAASPSRGGRHQVKRSITEVTSPKRHQSRHSTSHHHHHHPFHHVPLNYSRHRREKTVDAGVPQSAHPTVNRHSIDMWRPEGGSRNQSRRGSQLVVREKDDESRSGLHQPLENVGRESKLRAEQEKASLRVEGLKQSLSDLHTFSTTASRRLDETYYAVLEKMSSLQNTVTALKDLAESSREIYVGFEKDAGSLESDITRQLDAFGQFDDQQAKIESLQERIKGGRTKIQTLSDRVDAVRRRVESWERADREWQERTRRRLRVTWTIFFGAVVLVGAILLSLSLTSEETLQAIPDKVGIGKQSEGATIFPSVAAEEIAKIEEQIPWKRAMEANDDRLRGLDEL